MCIYHNTKSFIAWMPDLWPLAMTFRVTYTLRKHWLKPTHWINPRLTCQSNHTYAEKVTICYAKQYRKPGKAVRNLYVLFYYERYNAASLKRSGIPIKTTFKMPFCNAVYLDLAWQSTYGKFTNTDERKTKINVQLTSHASTSLPKTSLSCWIGKLPSDKGSFKIQPSWKLIRSCQIIVFITASYSDFVIM